MLTVSNYVYKKTIANRKNIYICIYIKIYDDNGTKFTAYLVNCLLRQEGEAFPDMP